MKIKSIILVKYLLLTSLLFQGINVFSQSSLKTYKGPYPAIELNVEEGLAQYSYLENPSGGRIYEGPFDLKWGIDNEYYLRGEFKNNKQNGIWKAKWNDGRNTVQSISVSFKDGIVDGPVSYKDDYESSSKNKVFLLTIDCNFKDGKLSGPFKYKCIERGDTETLEGQFENNLPIGVWKRSTKEEKISYEFKKDSDPRFLTVILRQVDVRTGDVDEDISEIMLYNASTVSPRSDFPYGFDVIELITQPLSDIILRDSKSRERWYLELK